ncbi:MAG: hypothetical protein EBS90_10030 [Betaproteobacteria bacterium]|nr:hypothetical protein [Betaproteobacteria bacterium]
MKAPESFRVFEISHDGIDFLLLQDRDGFYSMRFETATGDLLVDDENLEMVLSSQDNAADAIIALGDYIGV